MNPEPAITKNQIEARLTALLLNELPEEEAALLRWTLSQDPSLPNCRPAQDRHRPRARSRRPSCGRRHGESRVRRLSEERRRRLLEHFKTPRRNRNRCLAQTNRSPPARRRAGGLRHHRGARGDVAAGMSAASEVEESAEYFRCDTDMAKQRESYKAIQSELG